MLNKPSCGWTNVVLIDEKGKEWSGPASYLTSVHNDCLDAFIDYYNSFRPQCVHFDAEGWDFMIIIETYYVYVIVRQDREKLLTFEIKADNLSEELIKDIESNIDAWSAFDCDIDNDRDKKLERKRIEKKIELLKKAKKINHKMRYGG